MATLLAPNRLRMFGGASRSCISRETGCFTLDDGTYVFEVPLWQLHKMFDDNLRWMESFYSRLLPRGVDVTASVRHSVRPGHYFLVSYGAQFGNPVFGAPMVESALYDDLFSVRAILDFYVDYDLSTLLEYTGYYENYTGHEYEIWHVI